MGVKFYQRYCSDCDTYDLVEECRDTCLDCGDPLSSEADELSDAAREDSCRLPSMMVYKLIDALERVEELESELYKLKLHT